MLHELSPSVFSSHISGQEQLHIFESVEN